MEWNLSTDVVVIGAGATGLAAAVSARDHGAAVVVVEENYDIGGHAMLGGGRVHLDRAAGLRHPRMAYPGRGDCAAAQPQRLGAGAPSRRKRAQQGRADSAQA